MVSHNAIHPTQLLSYIRKGDIVFGGNRELKIYGKLACRSGKRMKIGNRVFFATEEDAIAAGYRPCGLCMRERYVEWKSKQQH